MKAFALNGYQAAVVAGPGSITIVSTASTGVVVYGAEAVQSLADACREAGADAGHPHSVKLARLRKIADTFDLGSDDLQRVAIALLDELNAD